jgi:hypothetical protein
MSREAAKAKREDEAAGAKQRMMLMQVCARPLTAPSELLPALALTMRKVVESGRR